MRRWVEEMEILGIMKAGKSEILEMLGVDEKKTMNRK